MASGPGGAWPQGSGSRWSLVAKLEAMLIELGKEVPRAQSKEYIQGWSAKFLELQSTN